MNSYQMTPGTLNIELLEDQLNTRVFGRGERLLYLPVVDSTNLYAMQLARKRPDEGVVVLTDSQTAGKGRQGRRWVDVSGRNVLLSLLLRPHFLPRFLVMMASLAVVEAIAKTCNISATIKWPNDVLIRDRKVAGILIETSHGAHGMVAVVGIGVNVNGQVQDLPDTGSAPLPLTETATTLEAECGHSVSRELFIAHLLRSTETYYDALQAEVTDSMPAAHESASCRIREQWRSQLSTLGRHIQVHQGETVIDGIAEGVDDNGELLLRGHSGEIVNITWGDIGYPVR